MAVEDQLDILNNNLQRSVALITPNQCNDDFYMMIRQDFQELPPKAFMRQIMDTTTGIYVFLWDSKDEFNMVSLTWKDLEKLYNKNSFRTSLRRLCNEGLLNYDETKEVVSIELVGWEDVSDE